MDKVTSRPCTVQVKLTIVAFVLGSSHALLHPIADLLGVTVVMILSTVLMLKPDP